MTSDARITVYSFRTLEAGYESAAVSGFKATRRAILERFGGEPIESTAERVEPGEVDTEGRFRRLATGWGDLS